MFDKTFRLHDNIKKTTFRSPTALRQSTECLSHGFNVNAFAISLVEPQKIKHIRVRKQEEKEEEVGKNHYDC